MNKLLVYILVIGGASFYSQESSTVAADETESQASIRFIKGDFIEEPSNELGKTESTSSTSTNKEVLFPKTGEKMNDVEIMGASLVGLVLILNKIKVIRKEDLK